jgi:DNA-directed RNA polymerase subunit RPC12/RpoP
MNNIEKCNWVTGMISSYLMGKDVKYDLPALVAELVEYDEGGYKCKLCSAKFKLNNLIRHFRRKHCAEIIELWDRVRPERLYISPGGRQVLMKVVVQCKGCGYIMLFEVPANYGPPSIKQFIAKQYMQGALFRCPSCGRTLGFWDGTLRFVPEREVLGKTP